MTYLGIDIGGTGIKAGIVDATGHLLHQAEVPTMAAEGTDGVLTRVTELADMLTKQSGLAVKCCGVGVAGRIDYKRGVVAQASGNLPGWTGLHMQQALAERLGMPVVIDNDVNVAALAEGWIGSAKGVANFLTVTLGTGVGAGVVIGGRIWRGARWGAGEVGHLVLYPHGQECLCGGRGCAEQYISARALTRRANEVKGEEETPFRGIRDVILTAQREYQPRCPSARLAIEGFVADLAIFMVNLQEAFDPQVIVVGGGIVRLGYWWERLMMALEQECRPRSRVIWLRRAHCGPYAGVVGAARLAMQTQGRES